MTHFTRVLAPARNHLCILAGAAVLAAGLAVTAPASAARTATIEPKQPELTTPWTAEVSAANALPDYPRPQLVRPQWQNLNGEWQFSAATPGQRPPVGTTLGERVLVPYPIESALSGIKRHVDRMFYRRTFEVPARWNVDRGVGKRLILHFGAVDYDARVWVNGVLVRTHRGGYDEFSADVTRALRKRGAQELIVGATDFTDQRNQPTGKQRNDAIANPGGIFYTPASGIWRTVWMEPLQRTHMNSVVTTTASSLTSVRVRVNAKASRSSRVRVSAWRGNRLVGEVSGRPGRALSMPIRNPRLWSPDRPFLYDLDVRLVDRRGRTTDRASSYFGMRTIGLRTGTDGKKHVVLNHEPEFLNSTLDQGYWPDGIYTAPTDDALKFDLQAHKDLGFNTVRKHIKVEPDRWYYWADRLGLMVWQDMPSMNDGPPDQAARDEFERQLHTMVRQHKGWASIIGWVPFNEGWGEWDRTETGRIADAVKAQDPSRLVDAHSGVNCCNSHGDSGRGDVIDWHTYTGPASPSPTADRAAIDGEHGGFGLVVDGHTWPGTPGAYQMAQSKQELTDLYVQNQTRLLQLSRRCGLSGGIYTQITDVEDEVNGLYTYDRQLLKMVADPVRAINERLSHSGNLGSTPSDYPPGTPGLDGVHRWAADEGTGSTAADSVGDADLTLTGAGWTDGRLGQALSFDGGGYAETTDSVFDTAGSFSVSAWVKLDATGGGFSTAVSQDGDRASAFFLQYDGGAGKFAFSTVSGRAYANATAEAGRWYHLVGVRDAAAGTYTLYLDGQKQGVLSQCIGDTSTGPLAVGRGKYDGNKVDFLRGAVDEIRVFDRALSPAEVVSLGS